MTIEDGCHFKGSIDMDVAGATALSAGEAQLLVFARVFLADPPVVVLDEASSRLDPETEICVTLGSKEGLANLAQAVTAPGDVILVPNPSYPIHQFGFIIADGTVRYARIHPDYTTRPEPEDTLEALRALGGSCARHSGSHTASYSDMLCCSAASRSAHHSPPNTPLVRSSCSSRRIPRCVVRSGSSVVS